MWVLKDRVGAQTSGGSRIVPAHWAKTWRRLGAFPGWAVIAGQDLVVGGGGSGSLAATGGEWEHKM